MMRAKVCRNCGTKLSFFDRLRGKTLCKDCERKLREELARIEDEVARAKEISDAQLDVVGKFGRSDVLKLYSRLYSRFIEDKELEEAEIAVLNRLQETFGLTDEEVKFNERVRPYIYVNAIRKGEGLPTVDLQLEGFGHLVLRKGEVVHFASAAVLKELRSVSLGYAGGSHGISIRVMKGVYYRVGAHRGRLIREQRLVETSRGALVLTNKRLILMPLPGKKPVNIPLKKILSYNCYENGIEIYKDGRQKPFFFAISDSGAVEIFGLCLGYLLGGIEE